MADEFTYSGAMRGPWFSTAAEDISLATSSPDDFGRSDWNEWMQWDPASGQNAEPKPPLNAQGPICYLKPGQRPPIYTRRQNSQLRDPTVRLQSNNIPVTDSAPQGNGTAYTFGGNVDQPAPFQFDGALSSPSVGDGQQQNGFYSPQGWDQQQRNGENAMFSPVGLEQQGMMSDGQGGPLSTPSLHHSPNSVNQAQTSSSSIQSSPEPVQTNSTKKRKSSAVEETASQGKKDKPPPVKKTAHNMIEKRYRTNLNDKIAALRDSVPSLRVMSRGNGAVEEDDDPEDLEGLTPAHKLNKATVLSKATEYIRHLEKRNKRLQDELNVVKSRLENYEKMSLSGTMALGGGVNTPDGARYTNDPFSANSVVGPPVSGPPQGMIPVPESMANLHRGVPPQPHYAPQNGYPVFTSGPSRAALPGPPLITGRRGTAMMGKLMVGSLAGLMILEGLVGQEQSGDEPQGRGLLALPFNLANIMTARVSVSGMTTQLPLAKLLLISFALFYIIAPLFDPRPKQSKKAQAVVLKKAPSLASPVEVRQKAWLTAIQTVWVPRHNFLLELAALFLKTLKLSTRKVIGWHGYSMLTGATKEQEIARVKAWDIALDAQLTGGDAEISKSRLILTLLASGTLPDTPARLMLKALHFRVLLWELSTCGYGTSYIFREISAKVARSYWNAARHQQKIAANSTSKPDTDAEPLPVHLAALLELECDDVLVDTIIQRAYNLAWNRPSAEKTTLDVSMDSVVEDFTISSPLDALAAWWSSFILNKALIDCLDSEGSDLPEGMEDLLELASRAAPPLSQAQLRALVAKAVISSEDRTSHITAALQVLPTPPSQSVRHERKKSTNALMNPVGTSQVASDVGKALTLAKCLSLIESTDDRARRRAIPAVNRTYLPPSQMTLLSCVAAYKLVVRFLEDPELETEASRGLEHLVCSVRMWVGQDAGKRSGLDNRLRGKIVEKCLAVSKKLVGLKVEEESDAGYVSQDE
jgi:hypothetical protein